MITCLIHPDGSEYWYKDGKSHRENGPAIINTNGKEYWYKDDKHVTLFY